MAAFTNQGIRFHKATESPGKRPFYLFFKVKGRKHQLCDLYRFKNGGIIPAECNFGKPTMAGKSYLSCGCMQRTLLTSLPMNS